MRCLWACLIACSLPCLQSCKFMLACLLAAGVIACIPEFAHFCLIDYLYELILHCHACLLDASITSLPAFLESQLACFVTLYAFVLACISVFSHAFVRACISEVCLCPIFHFFTGNCTFMHNPARVRESFVFACMHSCLSACSKPCLLLCLLACIPHACLSAGMLVFFAVFGYLPVCL